MSSIIKVTILVPRCEESLGLQEVPGLSTKYMIEHYLSGDSEDLYDSDGRRWFVTGDQTFMDAEKCLYIVGRHKDTIVPGGENLSPAKIEGVLTRKPELLALEPQVVARDDDIAGEVPVVITRGPASYGMEDKMHETIREKLGVRYLPRAYISLDSLGLNDFPRAASGKIQKAKLRSLLSGFIKSESSRSGDEPEPLGQLPRDVPAVWLRLLGIPASQLDVNAPISHLADSPYAHVSLEQWLAAPTIADQIKALGTTAAEGKLKDSENISEEVRSKPLSTEDMVYLGGDASAFNATKEVVEKTIVGQGFAWDDSRVINTWNIRTTIVSQNASVQDMRAALEQTLLGHPLMLSYMVTDNKLLGDELGLYVTLRHSRKVLDECILDYGTADTLAQLQKVTMNYPFKDHAMLPGPLFRCLVFFVQETNTAAVLTNDITYHSMFHEDLDRALGGQSWRTHPSFKAWAKIYHILRRSPGAASDIQFHTEYLTDLQDLTQALWPHPTTRLTVSPERVKQDGHVIVFAAPSFIRLQTQYPTLTTPVILKAALALMSIPEAADVAWPTFGGVLNLVPFQPTETVLEYLLQIQSVEESMIFNWMPGLGPVALGESPFQNMTVKQTHIRTKLGMLASAGAGGADGSQILLYLQGASANTSSLQVGRAAQEMKSIALWLTDDSSLHRQVGEFTKRIEYD
ncbi:hypothetical protein PISL3812_09944 [Talaromyces islandicus]|uniref:Uncharacterized protein n=1 Tax=Talaromyces islandicus TaxID=28573 RepID=A0A0U1MCX6_TALIS|nr:hypothetical protein PISL3812_09944 [Talaromyces islandicus]